MKITHVGMEEGGGEEGGMKRGGIVFALFEHWRKSHYITKYWSLTHTQTHTHTHTHTHSDSIIQFGSELNYSKWLKRLTSIGSVRVKQLN